MAGSRTPARGERPARRPPARRADDGGGRRGPQRSRPAPSRPTRRYAVVHDPTGPKVRLGVLWFLVAAVAVAVGPLAVGAVYGITAAVAAAQTARAWRRRRFRPNEQVAAVVAGAMGVGAVIGAGGAGLALLAGVIIAYAMASGDAKSPHPVIGDTGWTLQCALGPGVAAMSMVLLTRLDRGSALALLLLVSAYETGDYLVGTGAKNPLEGPVAGGAAIAVITFILSTTPLSALSFAQAWLFGGAVVVLAPLGQLAASALLPAAGAPASALRRLDSLLLAAPFWSIGIGLVI